MMILLPVLYSVSVVYIIMYALKKSLLMQRRWTLLKNVDWTLEHPEFTKKYLQVSPIPFVTATFISIAFILYGFVYQKEWILYSYMFGLYAGMALLALIYVPKEIQTYKKIPFQAKRTARLSPRALSNYIPSWAAILAHTLVIAIFVADFVMFATNILTIHRLIANLSLHIVFYSITYTGIIYSLKERSIHMRDITGVTDHDIHEEARAWGIRVFVVCLFFFITMSFAGIVSQLFGYEMMNPTAHLIITQLGGQDDLKSLFSKDALAIWSAVSVILMFPLFHIIFQSKPIRILQSIRFTND